MMWESKTISHYFIATVKRVFSFFSSLKTAIPLLVITIVITIGGTLFPQPDLFKTWWYLGLLGLNGVSLLFVTILHIPMILQRKGRNALIGVVVTHLGILILIIGVMYGGMTGLRHQVKAIEQEMTIVPGLPFVIRLEKLVVEEYEPDAVAHLDPETLPKKRQESHLSFFKNGELVGKAVAAPGTPANVEGITVLPNLLGIGWYFELIVTDPLKRKKTFPVKPWSPPIFEIGQTQIMAHSVMNAGELKAQVFTKVDGQIELLGIISREQGLELNGHSISLGKVKRYTSLSIYNRPHAPVLVIGCLAMLFGLIWHFYFRHRDRNPKNREKIQHV